MSSSHGLPLFRELPTGRLQARKTHLLDEITRRDHAHHRLPGRLVLSRRFSVVAIVITVLTIAGAVAASSGWLTGTPAPQPVIDDFGSYTPQLGFNPESGRARLVADDGDVSLYATTNTQGSYCLIASAPWKRPASLPDGGTCIPPEQAAAPLIAGVLGAASTRAGTTLVIAGRTQQPNAEAIRFTDPYGQPITATIGSSGFFIKAVRTSGEGCPNSDWKPTFIVLDTASNELARATITIGYTQGNLGGACAFGPPHR
jgi:hypothetical protein